MSLVLLGAPGCGKGTQAAALAEKLGVPTLSTGDAFRDQIARRTELGLQIADLMKAGELVPDPVVVDVVRSRLAMPDCRNGFILDGFPRTLPQAENLEAYLEETRRPLWGAYQLEVDEEIVIARIGGRAAADRGQGGREDDAPEIVRKRLAVYAEQTRPLIAWYRRRGLLRSISGGGEIDDIHRLLFAAVTRDRDAAPGAPSS